MNAINNMYSLTNTLLSGTSAMQNMRLQLALGSKSLGSQTGMASSAASGYVNTVGNEAGSFLTDYRSNLETLKGAAKEVVSPKKGGKLEAGSEDNGIAVASGNLAKASDTYTLKVEQLATGQINRADALVGGATLPTIGGALRIETGQGAFNLSLSASGYKTNADMLKGYAGKINALNAGVTAKVTENKDGTAFLEVTGEGAFKLSGSFAERTGLDQVAEEAKEAVFTVAKNGTETQQHTSATNKVEIDGLTVQLKGVGETVISAGKNQAESTADSLDKLVSSFNKTLSFLNKNGDWGMGALRQIKRMVTPPVSEKSMAQIGISIASDGSLSFDRTTFAAAMERDSKLTQSIVERVAQGIESDATAGLNESSYNLVGNALGSGTGSSSLLTAGRSYDMDTISFLSAYNKNGVFNAMNMMAVGALMNISI